MAVVTSNAYINPLGLSCVPPREADKADEETGRDHRGTESPPGAEAT
jgi:hypothetical protein